MSLRAAKRPPNGRCKFNWSKLSDLVTCNAFNIELANRFKELKDEATADVSFDVDEIQMRADCLDTALRETSEKVLGKVPKRKHAKWVREQTHKLLEKCNKAGAKFKRTQLLADTTAWHQLQGEVSAAFDSDKAAHLDTQLAQLELADSKRELGNTWKLIREIADDKPKASPDKVRCMDGSLPDDIEGLLKEWRNYFSQLLNNRSVHTSPANHPAPSNDNRAIKTTKMTRGEVDQAIKDLKRNKSPGPDYAMTAEVLKDGGHFIVEQLHTICQLVFDQRRAPKQWTSSMIVPLPKKGNLQQMTNYRGICLMSIAAKVYNRILLNRIRGPIDKLLRKNQAGFRTGRSCIQQIHILRRIMDGADSEKLPIFITFIDFKKAFDSIDRPMMFAILRHYGIPEKIVEGIRVLYDKCSTQVFLKGQLSESFNVTTGVLQGDVLAPFLFIIVIDYISSQSAGDFGYLTHKGSNPSSDDSGRVMRSTTRVNNPSRKMNDLAFADDIALLENDADRSQQQLTILCDNAKKVGLEINASKTEQMRRNETTSPPAPQLTVDGKPIAIVDEFKYLGSYMSSTEKDIQSRIGQAWGAFNKLKTILTSKKPKPDIHFKIRLFNAACVSILLYGCESWILTQTLKNKLDIFARKIYRIMLGIRQKDDHITNGELYRRVQQRPISDHVQHRQLKFVGHILRMPETEPVRTYALYESKIKDKREVGRPKTTYTDQISLYLSGDKQLPLTANVITEAAENKLVWNNHIAVFWNKKPPDPSTSKPAR